MSETALLDQMLDPFTQCLDESSARRVIDFGLSASVQQKMDALAERANEGLLTAQERTDYEALINAADFIAILKLKAKRRLSTNRHP